MSQVIISNRGPGPIQIRSGQGGQQVTDMGEGSHGQFLAPLVVLTPDEVALIHDEANPADPGSDAAPPLAETAEEPTVDILFALAKTEHVDTDGAPSTAEFTAAPALVAGEAGVVKAAAKRSAKAPA